MNANIDLIIILHFNMDNSKSHKEVSKSVGSLRKVESAGVTMLPSKVKGSCFAHNYNKDGCTRTKCTWDHHCMMCDSKSHVAEAFHIKKVLTAK